MDKVTPLKNKDSSNSALPQEQEYLELPLFPNRVHSMLIEPCDTKAADTNILIRLGQWLKGCFPKNN